MTPFPARSLLFGLCCGLLLTACDDDRIHNICANYPALCQDLVDDGWCRYERSDIIRARTFDAFFPLILVAVLYFLMSYLLIVLMDWAERRTDPRRKPRKVTAA